MILYSRILLLFGIIFIYTASYSQHQVYYMADPEKTLALEDVINNENFARVENINALNFGFSESDHWIKIIWQDSLMSDDYVHLCLATVVPDTIEIYREEGNQFLKTYLGEAFSSHLPFNHYYFKPNKSPTDLYIHILGHGQPLALPLTINHENIQEKAYYQFLLNGALYGVILFIVIINTIIFLVSKENLYLYFLLFNIFSFGVVFYFDGWAKILIGASAYWNNEFIAICFCGSFWSINLYVQEFFKIKKHKPNLIKYYQVLNILIGLALVASFWQPNGFQVYMIMNLLIAPLEFTVFFCSIWIIRNLEKDYLLLQIISISMVSITSCIAQLYFMGLLPIHTITLHAIPSIFIPQILIQSYALGKRFRIMRRERSLLQKSIEQQSQALIETIENERKRLSSEFHDGIGQNLLVIRNRLLLLIKSKQADIEQRDKLVGIAELTSETLDEIRVISHDLRPSTLDTIGLTATLINMIVRLKNMCNIDIQYYINQKIDGLVGKDKEINVYRILQELMNNVIKHSRATRVTIIIIVEDNILSISVCDNGIGFDLKQTLLRNSGNGLSNIRERVKLLHGEIQFETSPGSGLKFKTDLPTLLCIKD